MKFKCKISFKDYLKLNLLLSYKTPRVLVLTIVGFLALSLNLMFFNTGVSKKFDPKVDLLVPIGLIVFYPVIIIISSKTNYANKRVSGETNYDISEEKIISSGDGYNSETEWRMIYKIGEQKDWFLIYYNKRSASIISKKCLLESEIYDLRNILRSAKVPGTKLKTV